MYPCGHQPADVPSPALSPRPQLCPYGCPLKNHVSKVHERSVSKQKFPCLNLFFLPHPWFSLHVTVHWLPSSRLVSPFGADTLVSFSADSRFTGLRARAPGGHSRPSVRCGQRLCHPVVPDTHFTQLGAQPHSPGFWRDGSRLWFPGSWQISLLPGTENLKVIWPGPSGLRDRPTEPSSGWGHLQLSADSQRPHTSLPSTGFLLSSPPQL